MRDFLQDEIESVLEKYSPYVTRGEYKQQGFDWAVQEKYYIIYSIYPPEQMFSPICYSQGSFFASSLGEANELKENFLRSVGRRFKVAISADLYSNRLLYKPDGELIIKGRYINDEKFGKVFRCDSDKLLKNLFQRIQAIHKDLLL